jgi:DNA polymerase-3 subunit alpha
VPDSVLLVKGRLDKSEEEAPKLIAMEVTVPDLSTGESGPVVVTIPASRCIPPVIERFKEVLAAHPGVTEVRLALQNGPRTTVVRLDERLRVLPSPALYGDLKALLGPSCLQ